MGKRSLRCSSRVPGGSGGPPLRGPLSVSLASAIFLLGCATTNVSTIEVASEASVELESPTRVWIYDNCVGGIHAFDSPDSATGWSNGRVGCNEFPIGTEFPISYACWACGNRVWHVDDVELIDPAKFPPPGYDPDACHELPEPNGLVVLGLGVTTLTIAPPRRRRVAAIDR